jgi:hypothetical protein
MVPCALVSAGIGTMRRTGISFAGSMVVMVRFYRAALAIAAMAAGVAVAAEQPRTYALVGAIGNRFEVVHEIQSTGTHLAPYDRAAYAIPGDLLNRLAVQGLDRAIARAEPESRRIYLSTTTRRPEIELVIEELRKVDRVGWDRILVALPAYRYKGNDGMPLRTSGMGLFAQPLCQSDQSTRVDRVGSCDHGFRPQVGPMAETPSGKEIAANSYVAPFAFVEIWVLDPKTLAVLGRSANYGHRKLTDETAALTGIINGSNKDFLARQIVEVVQTSTSDALANGILRGEVEIREKGPVAR